jgi:hypothetical protein
MTTSSSSVPVLGPVLYFTQTDGYSYDVDNRPLFHLDTNIRHINTSLVGIGYGEHASLAGGQLIAGTAVLLAPNGSIFFPVAPPSSNLSENIVGLVIGSTDTGLNRVIWASKHLDLDVLGLTSITSGQAAGSYLTTSAGVNGAISIKSTPLSGDYVLGRIKSGPYIEINTASELLSNDVAITVSNAVKDNHSNLYGFNRFRNLLMYIDMGQAPMQYTKTTKRMSDYLGATNPLSAVLSPDKTSITAYGTDTTVYGSSLDNFILKEIYTNLSPEIVNVIGIPSTWSSLAYATTLPDGSSENYELQARAAAGSLDYNTLNKPLFKEFRIDKYYQYKKTAAAPLAQKLAATATVFNPLADASGVGGEGTSRIIVWDFYDYSVAGLETVKNRVITYGASSDAALDPLNNIFPTELVNLV